MTQMWHDLLFMHWPLPPDVLRPLLPPGLDLDTFDGRAWIGVVPFRMSGIRFRFLPPVPGTSAFPELNVRTYVTVGDKPGVWFFSLDASNRLAVAAARTWFRLPYFRARMATRAEGEWISYRSRRTHRGAPPGEFRARYRPTGPAATAAPGSLEHFLVERYCLYAPARRGGLARGEIDHEPWPLQPAECAVETNSVAPVTLPPDPPLLHFALRVRTRVWTLEPVPERDAQGPPRGRGGAPPL
mgnify:FL=1